MVPEEDRDVGHKPLKWLKILFSVVAGNNNDTNTALGFI
jgi:hypothetical protein